MSLDKMAGMTGGVNGMIQPQPIESLRKGPQGPGALGGADGSEFKKALEQVTQGIAKPVQGMPAQAGAEKLKFSNHAIDRMRSRGINFPPEQMKNIENGVARAAAKGAKDTLVLAGDNALIVSVKNNTVVTVMDRAAMKENVFTNIDSTVVV